VAKADFMRTKLSKARLVEGLYRQGADTRCRQELENGCGAVAIRCRGTRPRSCGLTSCRNRVFDRELAKSPAERCQRAGDMANEPRNTRLAGAFGTVAIGVQERRMPAPGRSPVAFVRPEKPDVSGEQLLKVRSRLDAMNVRFEALQKKKRYGMVLHVTLMVMRLAIHRV
jgi:hypothetical protein